MQDRIKRNRGENERIRLGKRMIGSQGQILSHLKNIHQVETIESIKGDKMHIWLIQNWEKNLRSDSKRRTGIYFKYDQNVDLEVKNACKNFARWLRRNYEFPMRVPIYIKGAERIKTMDGDWVVGSFFEPNDYSVEPYIRIATGDYIDLKNTIGRDNALASMLLTIAHELTHYYQWINNLQLTDIGRERQATRYSHLIVDEYALTRDHP